MKSKKDKLNCIIFSKEEIKEMYLKKEKEYYIISKKKIERQNRKLH